MFSGMKIEEFMESEHSCIFQVKLVIKNVVFGSLGTHFMHMRVKKRKCLTVCRSLKEYPLKIIKNLQTRVILNQRKYRKKKKNIQRNFLKPMEVYQKTPFSGKIFPIHGLQSSEL